MNSHLQKIWPPVRKGIQERINKDAYERWFQDLRLEAVDGTIMTFHVPNPIHQFFIESNFLPVVQAAVTEAMGTASNMLAADQRQVPQARHTGFVRNDWRFGLQGREQLRTLHVFFHCEVPLELVERRKDDPGESAGPRSGAYFQTDSIHSGPVALRYHRLLRL